MVKLCSMIFGGKKKTKKKNDQFICSCSLYCKLPGKLFEDIQRSRGNRETCTQKLLCF